jgi:hypothetical protein
VVPKAQPVPSPLELRQVETLTRLPQLNVICIDQSQRPVVVTVVVTR